MNWYIYIYKLHLWEVYVTGPCVSLCVCVCVCINSCLLGGVFMVKYYTQGFVDAWKCGFCEVVFTQPAPVAQWLARRTVGRKVWGSNPIRVMWDFSALAGSYPELGVLWAQWEGWNHTAELHPLNGCVFEGVALITWPTLQVPQFPGLVNTGIIVTVSVVCGPVK